MSGKGEEKEKKVMFTVLEPFKLKARVKKSRLQDRYQNTPPQISQPCVVWLKRIIFLNSETGYCVLSLQTQDKKNFIAVGKSIPSSLKEGLSYEIMGEWTKHPKYGYQLAFDTFIPQYGTDRKSIQEYLSSGIIKGIGPSLAKRIVDKFGTKTFEIFDKNPKKLLEIKGIGESKLVQIEQSWKQTRGLQPLYNFLVKYGISIAYAERFYEKYKENSVNVIKKNPYQLIYDIKGIGFKKADDIANNLGFTKEDPRRILAGLYYVMNKSIDEGHCYLPFSELLAKSQIELDVSIDKIKPILSQALVNKNFLQDGAKVYLPVFYWMETSVSNKIKQLNKNRDKTANNNNIDYTILKIKQNILLTEKNTGIRLTKEQKQAVINAFTKRISILTGGPGTGKTQTVRFILEVAKRHNMTVELAAPTGIASDRLKKVAGQPAATIHRLLQYDPKIKGFRKDEKNPIKADILIIDESSMIDLPLAYSLFKAISPSCNTVFVGDVDQLPSVGPGLILKDMIDSGVIPVTKLTTIFRQAEKSLIVKNAHRVNSGQPIFYHGNGFDFYPEDDTKKILEMLKETVINLLQKGVDPYMDMQIITPGKKGILGTDNLNKEFQQIINPPTSSKKSISFSSKGFTEGDKVMQIKNVREKGIFNGNVGKIVQIDPEEGILFVKFPDRPDLIKYNRLELNQLTLAYACTVHKYQGSEVDYVLMPLHFTHYMLLQRNLFYTAITRCKKHFYLFGQKKAVYVSIKKDEPVKRFTNLRELLREKGEPTQKPLFCL